MIRCLNCDGHVWEAEVTVPVEVTWDSSVPMPPGEPWTSITAVRVVREEGEDGHEWIYAVRGEPDVVCAGCGEKLLDWSHAARTVDEDAEWERYSGVRHPLWEAAIADLQAAELPEPHTWTSPPSPPVGRDR